MEFIEVKIRYATFDYMANPSWESYDKRRDEISFEWLNSLTQDAESDGRSKYEISLLDASGDWVLIRSDSDLTRKLEEFHDKLEVKIIFKKIIPDFEWRSVESTLGNLSESTEACATVAAIAKGMINDPVMRGHLDSLAHQIFSDSELLSEALREAVCSLNGTNGNGFKAPEKSDAKTESNDSDKTIEEILREMDGFKNVPKTDKPPSSSSLSSSSSSSQPPPLTSSSSSSSSSSTSHRTLLTADRKKSNWSDNNSSLVATTQNSNSGSTNDGDNNGKSKKEAQTEEKSMKTIFYELFKKPNKEEEFLKCKEELRRNNINCTDEEIKKAINHCKTAEKAVCYLSQK